jgi:cell division transport system permease protein
MIGKSGYYLRQTAANIRGEWTASLLTVLVVTISFIIFGAFLLAGRNVEGFFEHFAGNVQIVFYMDDAASAEQIGALTKSLREDGRVKTATYISSQAALERLRRELLDAPEFLEGLTESPIPPSIEVEMKATLDQRPDLSRMVETYGRRPGVASVDAGDEFSDAFARVLAGMWMGGSVVAIFLTLSAVFIVANTIRLTIIRRRHEIDNMRLVGATNAFVNVPFLLEGVAVGVTGAAMATLALFIVYRWLVLPALLDAAVMSVFTGFNPRFLSAPMVLAALFLGAFVGWLGAQMSVGRYLKGAG